MLGLVIVDWWSWKLDANEVILDKNDKIASLIFIWNNRSIAAVSMSQPQ